MLRQIGPGSKPMTTSGWRSWPLWQTQNTKLRTKLSGLHCSSSWRNNTPSASDYHCPAWDSSMPMETRSMTVQHVNHQIFTMKTHFWWEPGLCQDNSHPNFIFRLMNSTCHRITDHPRVAKTKKSFCISWIETFFPPNTRSNPITKWKNYENGMASNWIYRPSKSALNITCLEIKAKKSVKSVIMTLQHNILELQRWRSTYCSSGHKRANPDQVDQSTWQFLWIFC